MKVDKLSNTLYKAEEEVSNFAKRFPESAARLAKAKSGGEYMEILNNILRERNAIFLAENQIVGSSEPKNVVAPTTITQKQLKTLLAAKSSSEVKNQVSLFIEATSSVGDGAEELKKNTVEQKKKLLANMKVNNIVGLNPESVWGAAQIKAFLSDSEKLTNLVERKIKEGIDTATSSTIAYVSGQVAHFFEHSIFGALDKTCQGLMVVINDTDYDLSFKNDYCEHGKADVAIETLKARQLIEPWDDSDPIQTDEVFPTAGLVTCRKHNQALIGVEYGISFNVFTASDVDPNNGTDDERVPLAEINIAMAIPYSGKNRALTNINSTSKQVATDVNEHGESNPKTEKDGIGVEVRLGSTSGGVAYFITHIYNA